MVTKRLWLVLVIALVAAVGAAGCKTTPPEGGTKPRPEPTGPHAALLKLFPAAGDLADWKVGGDVKVYGPAANAAEGVETLEADLPTEAAIYRSYDYVKSGVRRYTRGTGETVTVRLVEMKSPSEAFGLFSVRTTGTQFPMLGLAARMSTSVLGFVKGSYFATVEYAGTNDPSPVLMEFGRWIADQVASPGYRPALLESFPLGSAQGERYYLHTFDILASLPFVPKSDPRTLARLLALGPQTDVAIMGYPTEKPGVLNYLFVVRYPTEGEAQAACTAYEGYLANSALPAEQNVAVAPPVRGYLAGTLNAEENSVNDQLARLLSGLGG